ncbi:MAG: MFS transporter [Crocinitomicaceae bacterium]|nr:MFS transporter [Crocinitomicaceae bacterium]
METIDDLPLESATTSDSHPSLSGLNFRLLLTTVCVDRLAYYGLRSVIILYAIEQLKFTRETAITHYGYLTLIVYASQLLGGFLGDFLIGAKNAILVGLGMCVFGALIITIEGTLPFYAALIIIAIGSGFIKTNTFSFISYFSSHDKVLLEKRFISMYAMINIGAFLSALLIGLIGEWYGYIYSFITVMLLYALGFALIFIISDRSNTALTIRNAISKAPKSITKSLLVVILVIVSSGVFWILFEKYSTEVYMVRIDFFLDNGYDFLRMNVWYVSPLLLLVLTIPYYFIAHRIPLYLKMAIALILIGVCWGAAVLLFKSELIAFGFTAMILFVFLEGIADIFLTPSVLTLMAIHTSKKYYGIIYGVYSIVLYGATRIINYGESTWFEVIFDIFLVALLVASIILYFVFPSAFKGQKSTNISLEE